ncbi:PREDICTED: uncharacterized protein LOC109232480 [Nicotiana attenuata]|uniref:uncharacterized protein LOC109232480 n=1 Tax=Nicotiana attenuata TaxID=49451 RepID=UPI000904CD0A|nr:PREDICTED: uncharacterized protein LOC109232480 [Nicotiana attenuata]
MSSQPLTVVTDSGERAPLLLSNSSPELILSHSHATDGEIVSEPAGSKPTPKQRLLSLDVFRGLTVALMILVDDVGKAFPSINHSPWFGVTLADFVMPFFLFIVGVSASLVFKKVSSKPQATKKVLLRTVKLFILGVFLQGGYFHGRDNLSYGVDIARIRWMGVLQRISIGYLFASILEIWLANDYPVDSAKAFVRRYFFQAVAGTLIGLSYLILLYGLYVPDWFFEISSLNMESPVSGYELSTQTVRIFLNCSKILLFSGIIFWWLLNTILFVHQTSVKCKAAYWQEIIPGPGDNIMIVVNYKNEEKQFGAEEICSTVLTKIKNLLRPALAQLS